MNQNFSFLKNEILFFGVFAFAFTDFFRLNAIGSFLIAANLVKKYQLIRLLSFIKTNHIKNKVLTKSMASILN